MEIIPSGEGHLCHVDWELFRLTGYTCYRCYELRKAHPLKPLKRD
jgi:hypothetical protein